MDGVDVRVNYIDAINAFNELKEIQRYREVKVGLNKGGKVLTRQGKINLKKVLLTEKYKNRGQLLRSFMTKVKKGNRGVLAGFNKSGSHAHLVDRGTKDRYHKSGKYVGKMKYTGYWTDVRNSYSITTKAQSEISAGIARAVQRLNKKTLR